MSHTISFMKKIYFGKQTEQALGNFPFATNLVQPELIYAICEIKKAACLANWKIGNLDTSRKQAIIKACDELLSGKFADQFPLPALQGGAGTSINMNVNEVIAERATEILKRNNRDITVHPNDHVNMSQSTNDVNPSALKIACLGAIYELFTSIDSLITAFEKKAVDFADVVKLGRTHLQDAVPTTLGEEFASYAFTIKRGRDRIDRVINQYFYDLNLGGTAIGNSINASSAYIKSVYQELRKITHLPLKPTENFMSQTSSQTDFCLLSQALLLLTLDLSKIASDLRLLASGPKGSIGEITLKELQPGSSIMPGKANPILPEAVNQLYHFVSGCNLTIEQAAHCSQLELANMFPIVADRLLSSLKLARAVFTTFAQKCIIHIKANKERCLALLERSTAYATMLVPKLGYDKVSQLVRETLESGKTFREVVVKSKLMTNSEFDAIVKQKKSR